MFILLETVRFKDMDEQHRLAFGDSKPLIQEMREKYPNKRLSFQTTSSLCKNEHLLNVYEIIEGEIERLADELKKCLKRGDCYTKGEDIIEQLILAVREEEKNVRKNH